jgi:hypothetical protein
LSFIEGLLSFKPITSPLSEETKETLGFFLSSKKSQTYPQALWRSLAKNEALLVSQLKKPI